MPDTSWGSAEVRFLNLDEVVSDLRRAAREARSSHPEILRVLLFGSLAQGNWTADSDADLVVVVRKDFPDLLSRSRYQIHVPSIQTDTLVYSAAEFDELCRDPGSLLSQALPSSVEL